MYEGTTEKGRRWTATVNRNRFGSRTLSLTVEGTNGYGCDCQLDSNTHRSKITPAKLQEIADRAEQRFEETKQS